MADPVITYVDERDYIYVSRSSSMDPDDVSAAMGTAFRDVMAFCEANKITPAGAPLSVYYTYNPERLDFRSGVFVSPEDAAKAGGIVEAAKTPAARVLNYVHIGPYRELRNTYGMLMRYVEEQGLAFAAPTWEIYLDDPGSTPEDKLRTDIFMALA